MCVHGHQTPRICHNVIVLPGPGSLVNAMLSRGTSAAAVTELCVHAFFPHNSVLAETNEHMKHKA